MLKWGRTIVPWCGHVSEHGGEGPIRLLRRFPVLWVCDSCGHVRVVLR